MVERIMMRKPKLALSLMRFYRTYEKRVSRWCEKSGLDKQNFVGAIVFGPLIFFATVLFVSSLFATTLAEHGVVVGTLLGIGALVSLPIMFGLIILGVSFIMFLEEKKKDLYSWAKKQEQLWEEE